MATVTAPRATAPKARNPWQVSAVLVLALVFFLAPWLAAAIYGFSRPGEPLSFAPLMEVISTDRGVSALLNTLLLCTGSTILTLVLLVPTIVYLNLKAPKLAKLAEVFSVLPLVIPAVALVSGVSEFYRAVAPEFLTSIWSLVPLYTVLTMPLCYRAIDASVKAIDLKTIFSASASLGASVFTTLRVAIIPNLKTGMLAAALLSVALCLGEYAIASLLLHFTFPVYMVEIASISPKGIAALSFLATVITWLLLVIISALSISPKQSQVKQD